MPQSYTILEQIEVNRITGQTFIQWRKQIVADNGAVVFAEPHRTSLEPAHYAVKLDGTPQLDMDGNPVLIPATDLAMQLAAVSDHLQQLGWPALAGSTPTSTPTGTPDTGVPTGTTPTPTGDEAVIASYDAFRLSIVPVAPAVEAVVTPSPVVIAPSP